MTSPRVFVFLASLTIVLWLLSWAKVILIPFALAVLLAFLLSPTVTGLQRRGVNRVASVVLVTLFAFLMLGAVGLALALQIKEFGRQLPQYEDNVAQKIADLGDVVRKIGLEKIEATVNRIEGQWTNGEEARGNGAEPIPVRLQSSRLWQLGYVVAPAADVLATAGLVVVLVIFMLAYREDLRGRLILLVGNGRVVVTTRAIDEAARRISRFLRMQLAINAGFGFALAAGLSLIGVPYALVWGFLAAVLRFIPYLGTWLAAALLVGFGVLVFPGWAQPLLVLALFVGLELLAYHLVEPVLLGHSTGIVPIALLIAAVFWTWLWGPIGLVLSTPLTTCLVVLGKYVPSLEFLDVLLADGGILDPQTSYYQRLLARDQDEAVEVAQQYLRDHPAEMVYDELLVPALVRTKRDRAIGKLSPEDEQFHLRVTREILDDVLAREAWEEPPRPPDDSAAAEPGEANGAAVLVFGCPARDEADELALEMFRRLLESAQCPVKAEMLSARSLVAEMVSRIKGEPFAVVCIAALPPGGLAQVRYLGKRLRAQAPGQTVMVGRWGALPGHPDGAGSLQLKLGVDRVTTTLIEARDFLVPRIRAHCRRHRAPQSPGVATPGL